MKLFKHPVHMMLLHFPAALLPLEFLAYSIYYFDGPALLAATSVHLLFAALPLGWLAGATGFADLIGLQRDQHPALNAALLHGGINTLVVTIYTIVLYKVWIALPEAPAATWGMWIMRLSANVIMLWGNYMGAELILKHKIAIRK